MKNPYKTIFASVYFRNLQKSIFVTKAFCYYQNLACSLHYGNMYINYYSWKTRHKIRTDIAYFLNLQKLSVSESDKSILRQRFIPVV